MLVICRMAQRTHRTVKQGEVSLNARSNGFVATLFSELSMACSNTGGRNATALLSSKASEGNHGSAVSRGGFRESKSADFLVRTRAPV
jgi:hypothetical protein